MYLTDFDKFQFAIHSFNMTFGRYCFSYRIYNVSEAFQIEVAQFIEGIK